MKDEHELDLLLHRMKGHSQASFVWGSVDIAFNHINFSAGGRGSPDSLLLLDVTLPLFGTTVTAKIPIALEAEKGGMEDAIQDLDKFTLRSTNGEPSYLSLPMLVLSKKSTGKTRSEFRNIRARFEIKEVALPRANK